MYYVNDKVKEKFDKDYFDGKEYVKKIKGAVKNKDIKSIGVYGKWGIGKTSIIKNVINELVEEGIYKNNQIVEYNAWKYSEYDFMRDFLIVCSNTIEGQKKSQEREESYYSDKSEDRQLYLMLWKKIGQFILKSWRVLLFVLFLYIVSVVGILWINKVQPSWFDCADLLTPLTLTLISFILPLFLVSEITHKSESKKFSPEQFARDFEEIVDGKEILVFIDDIDRCNYEEIKSTFDTLKTFVLDEKNKVKFIIPVDPNILFNSLDDQTYDYFSKIIDYSVEIKKYGKGRFEPLKEEILTSVDKKYKDIASDGLYLASKFYIDTPRKMKKFANEFINEIYNYSSEEIYDKGYMFAKLIILKNEFPNYYNSLIRNYDAVKQLTDDVIIDYDKQTNIESNKHKHGIIFTEKLLDFLSKTNSVDLYNFPMYEYKMSYAEYKIKAICEDPISKNKFDDNNKIDLNDNIKTLSYEFTENIIKPIENNKILYSNPIKRVCFLLCEFLKQKNSSCFEILYSQLMNSFDLITNDSNLYINENKDGISIKCLNIKYINECIQDNLLYLQKQNIDFQSDKLVTKILEIIFNDLDNTFKYCENDLFDFVQKIKINGNIYNEKLISIIEKFLISDFNKYSSKFDWYFKYGYEHGNNCFVQSIFKLAKDNAEIDKEIYKSYLTKKYSSHSINEYFDAINSNISDILANPTNFSFLIKPIITNLQNSDVTDENIDLLLHNTGLISNNEIINKLILAMLLKLKSSESYEKEKIEELLTNIGREYNATKPLRMELKEIIKKLDINELKLILGFDSEKKQFNNFEIFKDYEIKFNNNSNDLFNIICNTYCSFENYIIKSDYERHGFNLSKYKEQIKKLLKDNINSTIYLANDLNEEEINLIELDTIDINELKLEYIENKYLISKIVEHLKQAIDICIKNIKSNKDDKEIIKENVNIFLSNANKLYVDLKYNDKTLWTKLKTIDKYLALNELIDIYYIPKLKEYPDIVNLFENGKYKENYFKDNIVADRIALGIKQ